MQLNYHKHFCPCNDVVFSVMFENKDLFCRLCSSVSGKEIKLIENPHSQGLKREKDALLNKILFDVVGITENSELYSIDMQRSYSQLRQEARGVYYMCRAISTQPVKDMRYEDIKPVHISFLLTKHNEKYPVQHIELVSRETGKRYTDLVELILVYVNVVNKPKKLKGEVDNSIEIDDDLRLFSRFFGISSVKKARDFESEFSKNKLAEELIAVYNETVANVADLEEIEKYDYYKARLMEFDMERGIAEGIAAAVEKAEAKATKAERERAKAEKKVAELMAEIARLSGKTV
ncbi:hypothetical protein FACS1894188_07110 [Clostridia bacterium]|nr:hypothetical protein FACS1894188_07110 [Clostridia bacterium]